jgi:ferredoxin
MLNKVSFKNHQLVISFLNKHKTIPHSAHITGSLCNYCNQCNYNCPAYLFSLIRVTNLFFIFSRHKIIQEEKKSFLNFWAIFKFFSLFWRQCLSYSKLPSNFLCSLDDLELLTLQTESPECWAHSTAPQHLVYVVVGIKPRACRANTLPTELHVQPL